MPWECVVVLWILGPIHWYSAFEIDVIRVLGPRFLILLKSSSFSLRRHHNGVAHPRCAGFRKKALNTENAVPRFNIHSQAVLRAIERLDGFHDAVRRIFAASGFRAFDRDESLVVAKTLVYSVDHGLGVAEGHRLLFGRGAHV